MLPSTGNQRRKISGTLVAMVVLVAFPIALLLAGLSEYRAWYGNSGGSVRMSDAKLANVSIYTQCLDITGKLERRWVHLELHNAAAASMAWIQAAMVCDAVSWQFGGTNLDGVLEERSTY
ncbi:MAG: hypothetical protein HKL96_04830 [Phycisphaerales bacterium]|nr:hypothetical protein [Phycisphaerales bacterium]